VTWSEYTNTSPSIVNNTSDMGLDITINNGADQQMTLPYTTVAVADQSIRLLAKISNGSKLGLWQYTESGGDGGSYRIIDNSVSLHLMFDGTNDKWRVVSDDKIRAIEDTDNHWSALSGSKIKDHDGNLIEQSGVDVVGINTINGYMPHVHTLDLDIDVGKINSKIPVLNGDNATLDSITAETVSANTVTADTVTTSTLSLSNIRTDAVVCREIENTKGAIYNAIDMYYRIPTSESEPKPINIVFVRADNYWYIRTLKIVHKFGAGSYYVSGHYSYSNSYTVSNFNLEISPTTSAPAWGSKFYLYA